MIHRRRSAAAFVVAVCGLSFSSVAAAQSPATELDPVVVTATRTAQPLSDALPATTVITREDIDDSHAPDLATLLRAQAGFDVAQSGGLGSQTSLFLRGSNSNQVLVLVDGLRINAVNSGAASIAHLMIDQIDHVEIVRGNVSSLYGSEAIGGVVQIFTRGGQEANGAITAGASGTYGTEHTRGAVGRRAASRSAPTRRVPTTACRRRIERRRASRRSTPIASPPRTPTTTAIATRRCRRTSHSTSATTNLASATSRATVISTYDEASDYSYIDPSYNGRVQTQNERSRQTDATLYARIRPLAAWTIDLLGRPGARPVARTRRRSRIRS